MPLRAFSSLNCQRVRGRHRRSTTAKHSPEALGRSGVDKVGRSLYSKRMFTNKPWMLYGATGRTGSLIAEQAVAVGHRPLLAGRDAGRLAALADRLGLPWVTATPDDVQRVLGDSQLVLLAAGPFESTSGPV